MPFLQSPQAARTSHNDIELKVRADRQPDSVQDMTKNPALTSPDDATRLRGGGCCVRVIDTVFFQIIPIIYAYF